VRADQAQLGKVIEFCSRAKAPASITPSGGVIVWLLSGTVSNPAAGGEQS
jgi:RNA polymerase sigma-70 factor, ECF subfamily